MMLADEEVGVVANAKREVGLDIFQREEAAFVVGFREALSRAVFRPLLKDLLEVLADLSMHGAS